MKGRTSKRILSALLSLVMLLSLLPVAAFADDSATTATLVTDASTLQAGDQVIIANAAADYALGTKQKTNNRAAVAVTASEGSITLTSEVQILTLAKGTKEGTWAFNAGTGYLYAASSSSNHLKTEANLSDNSSWTISIAADGVATITAQGENTHNLLRFNPNNGTPLFAAYAKGQQDIALYKLNAATVEPTQQVATPTGTESGDIEVGNTVSFACETVDAALQYKIDDGTYQPYTGPVPITTSCTITVKATKDGMTDSKEAVFHYKAYELVDKYVKTTEIADGDQVIIVNPANLKALSTEYKGFNNKGTDVTITDGVLAGYTDADIWTVGANDDGSYTFSTAEGKKLAMGASYASTPLDEVNTAWEVSDAKTAGCFYIKNAVRNNYLEWFASEDKWSSYSDKSDEALFAQQFYKLTQDKQYVTGETPDPEPEPEVSTIADALAGAEGAQFTVKGVVTLVDGQNYYLQDATGGICLRLASKTTDIALGDTIIGTGTRAEYRGMAQLGSGTYEKSSGLTLTAKAATIGALTAADVCTYVKLTGLEVTDVYDNDGQYSNPNITLKDADGNTIQLYKAVINKVDGAWEYAVGDKVDVTAAVSINNTTLQLRNTKASEITKARENGIVTTLSDGDTVVIFNPANGKALSTDYAGTYYNQGTDVTLADGKLTGYTKADIWTVGINADGTYTFSTAEGKKLSMDTDYSSMPLDKANTAWEISAAKTADCFYIKNANRGNDIEWYAEKSNWSSYSDKSDEALFAQQFYLVVNDDSSDTPDTGDLPTAGSKVVIYSAAANAALAAQDDNAESPSITKSGTAEVTYGKLTKGNGAAVFTVEQTGEYLRFKNDTYGYLCANGTGNNAFYSKIASEDADWLVRTCSGGAGGFELESRTAKFNGRYSQWMEYYSDSFKVYSMDKSKVTDYTIYSFYFYPVAETVNVTGGIVNQPAVDFGTVLPAYVGQDYELTFTVDAPFGVDGDMTATLGEKTLTVTKGEDGNYTAIIPVDMVKGDKLTVTVSGKDTKNVAITGEAEIEVKDEPTIVNPFPAKGAETGDDKRPAIGATVVNAGEDPIVTMTVNDAAVTPVKGDNGKYTYTPAADMSDGRVTVTMTVTRANDPTKTATLSWFFTVGEAQYQMYFGQLHSHTQYSDGSGSLESALAYVKSLPESANVQFVAFTDHSNYFDKSGAANPEGALYDMSLATEYSQSTWSSYKSAIAAFNAENNGIVAIGGFEMTWSGGPGHINTFNTPGIVSRNNSTLNNKTDDAGMKAYYNLLSQTEGADSISQFNHPGKTFGNFSDFSYWDGMIDTRMYMVEVGNGEGQIGAGGYYPSYEQYIMALDKGWHVAPTNNQDNHKGRWGNANDARDVIITDDFSEEGIYAAIRERRMYATEDKNLEVTYTVNGNLMGAIIEEIPAELDISITVSDPDASDSISKVEIVANSGRVVKAWDTAAELASGELSATLKPEYSYYFVRVTEGDGDLAVTAPVWVGDTLKLGITSTETNTATPVTGEELTVTTTLFNSEATDATVKTITYTIGGVVIGTDTTERTLPANGTLPINFQYTPTSARVVTITVTAIVVQDGKEFTFTKDITLDVLNADSLVYIGIDASHYNEYVNGNYPYSMGNFSALAAEYSIRTVTLNTSEDLIAACANPKYKALILTVPSRRNGTVLRDPYLNYTDAEITAIKGFNEAGGTVILAGWSDFYESYSSFPAEDHMAAQQNRILSALGSSLRISDDGTLDDTLNGGQPQRLYFSTYNLDHPLMSGVDFDPDHPNDVLYTERFSHYGGASIYAVDASGNAASTLPATVSPMVYGHATTASKDQDSDGLGGTGIPKYTVAENDSRLLVMATEQLSGKGLIVVSGAAFMSNFEVQAQAEDSGAEKNYSNYKICENLLNLLNPTKISTVAEVQAEKDEGVKFTIEAIVTSNASGYDKDTAFFDCIYAQDDTAGINCFPVAGNFKVGDKVRITGTTSSYQGERQLSVSSIKKIGEAEAPAPKAVTAEQVNDGSVLGSLIKVSGTVTKIELADGLVQTIMVKDAAGNECRIFIDGYITINKTIADLAIGCKIEVIGLASYDNTFVLSDGTEFAPRIRIRDRDDITCTKSGTGGDHTHNWGEWVITQEPTCTKAGSKTRTCDGCGSTETVSIPATGHTYVNGKCTECGAAKPANPAPSVKPATPVKSGTTADTSNMGLWLVMLSLSLFGSVTLLRSRKRRA